MTASANRASIYTIGSGASEGRNGEKKDLWSSMLDSVASGKRLPEKNLIVLGGTPDSQREFLGSLSTGEKRGLDRQNSKVPPVANSFALGYTYYDVLDTDQEDILARISLYLLSSPSPSFPKLMKPRLTPETIPNTLVVVLLDWAQPHLWMRQLREWILFMQNVLQSTDGACQEAMQDVMVSWRDRGRGGGSINLDGTGATATSEGDVALPLGPGEWEEGLGLPLCVVCQNAEKMEILEKTQSWKEADFDQVLQYLRTILLRHGASLIYTTPNIPSSLPSLIHSSLGITSLLKRQPLKHNVIDRDKILVPPNWDSWGKIRVLRDGFDVEAISQGWSHDLQSEFPSPPMTVETLAKLAEAKANGEMVDIFPSAVAPYEEWVRDPNAGALHLAGSEIDPTRLEISSQDTQSFLENSLKALEVFRVNAAPKKLDVAKTRTGRRTDESEISTSTRQASDGRVSEHIGPVQFNMGGIQVDADDMVQRLKDRQEYSSTPDPTTPPADVGPEDGAPMDNDKLQAFFSGLMNRKGGGNSVTNSPRGGS